jgi:HPt (histidine-containing phosphotransfer) domain-containing protein
MLDNSGKDAGKALLDGAHLHRYTGGDVALEAELYGLLRGQIVSTLDALARAGDDAVLWQRLVHTLKGAARGVGAMALGDACAAQEDRANDPASLEAIRVVADETLAAIDTELKRRAA